ncbi:MAG: hypothetical protein EBW68_08590 [Actinobacteria bacterium]|nr:hypothetical protein [Actinomycetota bacterium]
MLNRYFHSKDLVPKFKVFAQARMDYIYMLLVLLIDLLRLENLSGEHTEDRLQYSVQLERRWVLPILMFLVLPQGHIQE